jgi:SOS-response transcriptional repressor LexA
MKDILKHYNGEVMFKIVEFSGDEINFHSLNPRHDSIKVSSDEICIMHKVVHIRKK